MECELMQIVERGKETGLVLGRVLAMYIREEVILDASKHYIDTAKLKLIARMHSGWYAKPFRTLPNGAHSPVGLARQEQT
jgi:flavin reductase (DIM6/NTAB) family NADH-FMN oxidoreductase RutF